MDFFESIQEFRKTSAEYLQYINNEEQTKVSLVFPMLRLMGYDTTNPSQVLTEFVADVGEKKGEKVDIAVRCNGELAILIEVKPYGDPLTTHDVQLFRYFQVTPAKFAVLTDGVVYKFFSDIEEPNKMDSQPFFELNLMEATEAQLLEFSNFQRESFNVEEAISNAIELKYSRRIKQRMETELRDPSESFLRFWLSDLWSGRITQRVLSEFGPVVKLALNEYISERVSDRLRSAMESVARPTLPEARTQEQETETAIGQGPQVLGDLNIPEDVEAFLILKAALGREIDPQRLVRYQSRQGITVRIDGNVRKWVCRLSPRREGIDVRVNGTPPSEHRVDNVALLLGLEARLIEAVRFVESGGRSTPEE